jgi:hypothetical protein
VRPAGNFSCGKAFYRMYAPYTASCCFYRPADHSPFSCLIYFLPVSDEMQTLRLGIGERGTLLQTGTY